MSVIPFKIAARPLYVMGQEAQLVGQRGNIVDVVLIGVDGRPFSTAVPLSRVRYFHDERWAKAVSVMSGAYSIPSDVEQVS